MIPVTQVGNTCWTACAASILELPLDALPPQPDPFTGDRLAFEKRQEELETWMVDRNLFIYTLLAHEQPDAALPGYSILNCRVAEPYLDERHSLVCLNGEVVWDPNGFRVPSEWNGIIQGRNWQVCQPHSWNTFITLDPTKLTGFPLGDFQPGPREIRRRAKEILRKLNLRNPPGRPGVIYGDIIKAFPKIAAAYCDAATDELAEAAVLKVLQETRQVRNDPA
jgi:hypothetical protein